MKFWKTCTTLPYSWSSHAVGEYVYACIPKYLHAKKTILSCHPNGAVVIGKIFFYRVRGLLKSDQIFSSQRLLYIGSYTDLCQWKQYELLESSISFIYNRSNSDME